MINAFWGALAANVVFFAIGFIVNEIIFRQTVKKRRASVADANAYLEDLFKRWDELDEAEAKAEEEAVKPKPAAKKAPAKKTAPRKA